MRNREQNRWRSPRRYRRGRPKDDSQGVLKIQGELHHDACWRDGGGSRNPVRQKRQRRRRRRKIIAGISRDDSLNRE